MVQFQVLPGDSLVETFAGSKIGGEVIVCRECLVDGDLKADSLNDFWKVRAAYLGQTYSDIPINYEEYVKSEFDKLIAVTDGSVINLWFEFELFCQVNMWFCLSLLSDKDVEIYRIEPALVTKDDIWKGFGALDSKALRTCFEQRKRFSAEEIDLGGRLFRSFSNRDNFANLKSQIESDPRCFPYLKEVCEAAAEIHTRPKETLEELIRSGETDFGNIFRKFNKTEGVYGFGDLQVKKIYDDVRNADFGPPV